MSENQSMRKMKDRKKKKTENFPSINDDDERKTTSLATQKDKKDEKKYREADDEERVRERERENYWKKYRITQFISRKKVKNFETLRIPASERRGG